MTFLHLLVLVVGVLAAVALADVLGHRGIGPWPAGLLVLPLVLLAGYLYSAWIAAFALGFALGAAIMLGAALVRSVRDHRRMRREERDRRRAAAAVDGAPGNGPGRARR
ncbi:hypothetical protein [Brachybacterium hainanense]|uniref:Integral membrane protein n=1 Tax=Brachybacterium hainanense TaxID=1541174 RepID=A0ABV6RE40_9MICO